jgi:uncharacterized membrane protein
MASPQWPQKALILAGSVVGVAALWRGLPEHIPPSGSVPGFGTLSFGAAMVAFLLPTALALTDVLLRGLCVRHPVDEASASQVLSIYDAIMLRFTAFVICVHALVLAGVLGLLRGREWGNHIVPVMLGLTMISVGNLLPRTRPNLAIGIRTRRTLSDHALWMRTHRSAGNMMVACGFLIVLSALAVPPPIGPGMILLVGPAALVGTGFLIHYSRSRANA